MKQHIKYDFPEQYRELAEEYVAYKHSLGFKYPYDEQDKVNTMLDYIHKNSTANPIWKLTFELVNSYACKHNYERPHTTHVRQSHIRQFAIFLNLRGINAYVYQKDLVKIPKDFMPYIFTKKEISDILYIAYRIEQIKINLSIPLIYTQQLYGFYMVVVLE